MIARDLLLAGVAPDAVRHMLTMASARNEAQRRTAWAASLMTLFTRVWVPKGETEPLRVGDALTDIEAWVTRFGPSRAE